MKNLQKKNQRGAVLIVSLLILSIMTLIGITAMSQSGLETLMANNLQLQTNSLSQAENQLTITESKLANISNTPVAYTSYDKNINPVSAIQAIASSNASNNNEFAGSYIEYLGPRKLPGESITIGNDLPRSGSEIYLFRNTAMHTSLGNGSRRIVQSTYAINEIPNATVNSENSSNPPTAGENANSENDAS